MGTRTNSQIEYPGTLLANLYTSTILVLYYDQVYVQRCISTSISVLDLACHMPYAIHYDKQLGEEGRGREEEGRLGDYISVHFAHQVQILVTGP